MTTRPLPPTCINKRGHIIYRHRFPRGTSRPNSMGARRECRNCRLWMVANGTPPRAKVDLNWKWPAEAFMAITARRGTNIGVR